MLVWVGIFANRVVHPLKDSTSPKLDELMAAIFALLDKKFILSESGDEESPPRASMFTV